MKKDRIIGIDLLKVISIILVLIVHFFLNTNYYNVERIGISLTFQSIIRNGCMVCVPLFITITGFLNKEKEYNKKFFIKLLEIIIIWLFYGVIEFVVLGIMNKSFNTSNMRDMLHSITSFKACGYSWYINMYIGLYFISPFINNTFDNFNKKNRLIALFLSIAIFILPSTINSMYGDVIGTADWWTEFYPVSYYILGKCIYFAKPKLNKKALIMCLAFTQLFLFYCSNSMGIWYTNIFVYLSTTLIFLIFYNFNVQNNILKSVITYLSVISLDIYLSSSLVDKIMYPIFYKIFKFNLIGQHRVILYAPVILITIFVLSVIYSSIRKKLINIR